MYSFLHFFLKIFLFPLLKNKKWRWKNYVLLSILLFLWVTPIQAATALTSNKIASLITINNLMCSRILPLEKGQPSSVNPFVFRLISYVIRLPFFSASAPLQINDEGWRFYFLDLPTTTSTSKSWLQQFFEIYTSLKTYINQIESEFSQGWGELSGDIQKVIQSSIGNLGIPDPVSSGKKIRIVIGNKKTDLATIDPQLQGTDAQHEWHQSYTLGQAESILSPEGQQEQSQDADIVNNAALTSSDTSDQAQNDIVTQDILKKMAVQNVQDATILKTIQQNSQQQTQVLAAANINLSDISERMDEQARRQELENNLNASQIIQSAVFTDGFWLNQSK